MVGFDMVGKLEVGGKGLERQDIAVNSHFDVLLSPNDVQDLDGLKGNIPAAVRGVVTK